MKKGPKTQIKTYVRPTSNDWWLKKPSYTRYILRELSGVVLGGYAILLVLLMSNAKDPAKFTEFLGFLKSPVSIVIHLVMLAAALNSAITFFKLSPRVLSLKEGNEHMSLAKAESLHFAALGVASVVILGIFIAMAR